MALGLLGGRLDHPPTGDPGASAPTPTSGATTPSAPTASAVGAATADAAPGTGLAGLDPTVVDPALVRVGRAVLTTRPDEADPDTLVRLLIAAAGPGTDLADPLGVAARVVADDFAAGRTVDVDGWRLAVSEARAAALLALACDAGPSPAATSC